METGFTPPEDTVAAAGAQCAGVGVRREGIDLSAAGGSRAGGTGHENKSMVVIDAGRQEGGH